MAAAVIADGTHRSVFGNRRVAHATLTTPANGSTWDTGLSVVENVQVTFNDSSTVAADSYAVTVSGAIVTFVLAGTARTIFVHATGR